MKITHVNRAFTLIEVLIVLGIISLLITMAATNFTKSNATAKAQTCISNLHHIDLVTQQWAMETRQAENAPVTAKDILPYMQGQITCPSGGKTFADSYEITVVGAKPKCLKVPATHKLPENTTQ